MQVAVKLFGPAAQRAGSREVRVMLEGDRATCAALRAALAAAAPALADLLAASRFAVNHEFAGDDDPVGAADEVALIAMVSGG
jgi:molybdopterin converting factor small subunit